MYMLDIKLIRSNPELVRENLKRRGDPKKLKLLDMLIEADAKWRETVTRLNQVRAERNRIAGEVAKAKREGREEHARKLIDKGSKLQEMLENLTVEEKRLREEVRSLLLRIPNLLHESVPYGRDENDNVVVRVWGEPPKFDFKPLSHLEILTRLGLIDTERAAKVSGRGFYYLKGPLVLLDLALIRFAIDFMVEKGFTLVEPPFMMHRKPYEGVTDLQDFEDVLYKVEGEDLYLIATSEHPMAAMYMNETILKEDLPILLVGVSPNFRKEVGTHGKYTKGLFRMHQFNKVEQFVFCLPEESWEWHEKLQQNCEEMYQKLGIHYRVVNVCTGDIGTVAAKKYDVEAWMADGKYREVGSNSNCTDYQARRLNIKYRVKEGQPPKGYVHTLNSTAIATSRTMIAIIEQNQREDGTVVIPEVLRPYMGGIKKLEPNWAKK